METFAWVLLLLSLLTIALWIYAIADIVRGSLGGSGNKVLWLIVVFFFPVLGALIYLLVGRKG